jgi:stage V sporulation protein B
VCNLFFVWLIVRDKPNYLALLTKPLGASLLMALCARMIRDVTSRFVASNLVCVAVAVALAVVIYGVLVVTLHIITRDDLALLPKGQKLARLLRIK